MRGFGAKTRIVLVGVIALILSGYGWWFLAPRPGPITLEIAIERQTFLIEPHEASGPTFVDATSDWLVRGRHVQSLAPFAEDLPDALPDTRIKGKFVHFELPAGAGQGVMEHALAMLASEGICHAVVETQGHQKVPLIRIVRFTDAAGRSRLCSEQTGPPNPG